MPDSTLRDFDALVGIIDGQIDRAFIEAPAHQLVGAQPGFVEDILIEDRARLGEGFGADDEHAAGGAVFVFVLDGAGAEQDIAPLQIDLTQNVLVKLVGQARSTQRLGDGDIELFVKQSREDFFKRLRVGWHGGFLLVCRLLAARMKTGPVPMQLAAKAG
jgi:hypothetical protein